MAGMYELWAPDGAVVHPDEWEETIRPGWALSLSLVDPRVPRPTNWRERPRAMRDDGEYLMGS